MKTKYIQYAIVGFLCLTSGLMGVMSIKGWGWFLTCGIIGLICAIENDRG